MKRIATILMCCLAVICANAQIYETIGKTTIIERQHKEHMKFEFYGKVGLNIMMMHMNDTYENDTKSKLGFDLDLGFMSHFRPSNPSNFYWGAELGLTQVGGESDYYFTSVYDYAVIISPSFGWKKEIFDNISLDLHFNPGIMYKFKQTDIGPSGDTQTYCSFKGGVGIWFKRFNLDFSYRLLDDFDSYIVNYSNIIISVGYKF